jgi:hypothetical protein
MPQGKCSFCGTFVTGGGTAMGAHSVACTGCTPLALKWQEAHGQLVAAAPAAQGEAKAEGEAK